MWLAPWGISPVDPQPNSLTSPETPHRFLVFVSNRPDRADDVEGFYNGSKQNGGRLWRVDRLGHGWSTPVLLPASAKYQHADLCAERGDGSLYFMTTDPGSGKFRLFRAQLHGDRYLPAQPLPFSDGIATDVDPAVSPDESFLVFGSGHIANRGVDLFIVFRNGQRWGANPSRQRNQYAEVRRRTTPCAGRMYTVFQ